MITIGGMGEVAKFGKRAKYAVEKAHRKAAAGAANKIGARARKTVINHLSTRLTMQKKYITGGVNRRTGKGKGIVWLRRANPFDKSRDGVQARVDIYATKMSLAKMRPKQVASGVKAGPFFVSGAFAHQKGKWHGAGVVVGKRKGKKRRPVEWQAENVRPIAEAIANRVRRAVGNPYRREYERQLERHLNREVGRI